MSGKYNHYLPKGKLDLKPKKHHGFTGLIVLLGFFVPPLGQPPPLPRASPLAAVWPDPRLC